MRCCVKLNAFRAQTNKSNRRKNAVIVERKCLQCKFHGIVCLWYFYMSVSVLSPFSSHRPPPSCSLVPRTTLSHSFSIHLSPTLWNFVQHFDFIEIASVAIISKISNIYFGVCVFAFDFPTLITLLPIVLCMSNSSIFTGSSHTVAGLGLRSLPYEFVNQSHG